MLLIVVGVALIVAAAFEGARAAYRANANWRGSGSLAARRLRMLEILALYVAMTAGLYLALRAFVALQAGPTVAVAVLVAGVLLNATVWFGARLGQKAARASVEQAMVARGLQAGARA